MGIIKSYKSASKQTIKGRETFDVTLALESEPNIRTNPKDIGLILDKSTSMSGQTLVSLKEGVNHFIDVITTSTQGSQGISLGGNSKIGIVSFSDMAEIEQVLTNSVGKLKSAVNGLQVRGTTNHAAAFEKGIELLTGSTKSRVLVLFTDGNSDTGKEGFDEANRAKAAGIEVYCIGFGNNIDTSALNKWASAPSDSHVLVTPNYQEIEKMFDILAARISEAKATGIALTDHVNKCFDIVSIVPPVKGTARIVDRHSIRWDIPSIGEKTLEKVSLTFKVKHNGSCKGNVPVNESFEYSDNELNTIVLPEPTVDIIDSTVMVYEDCPTAVDIVANGCEDYVTFDAGDIVLDNIGRVVQVSTTIKNVCPNKNVALAVILSELDREGVEHSRGMKTLLVPAHTESSCVDVKVNCVKFVLPEVLDVDGDPTAMCNDRVFKARFIANYVDSDFYCCKD